MLHTIVALVEDKPGVLNRVASVLRRRMLNVQSLSAARTIQPDVARMTIVIDTDPVGAGRVVATLHKLVNVLEAQDLEDATAVARDLALVKVASANGNALQRIVDETGARVVDRGDRTTTVEISGEPSQVDAAVQQLEMLGIVEMTRSGRVALARGDEILNRRQETGGRKQQVEG